MEVSGQLQAPAALPQGKGPWYPLYRRPGGPQSHSGHSGDEKFPAPACFLLKNLICMYNHRTIYEV
jgi:hypothetical protein